MQSNPASYDHSDSIERIDEILDASDTAYSESDSIPSRELLTFNNGFYANCTALFIDLRNSAGLPAKHKRPRLAKIYRAYISECVAVINGEYSCAEVNIHGDSVWGVFETPLQSQIKSVFETAARLNSLMRTLNCRLAKKGIDAIFAGTGMSYGRALMIKAGHMGSAINEVVWMGDVVNDAAHLCSNANKGTNASLMLSDVVYQNLPAEYQAFCSRNVLYNCYHANVINVEMDKWLKENCAGY